MSLQKQFNSERAWSGGPGIPDGKDIEIAVLGKPSIPLNERVHDYMPFTTALSYARKYPPPPLGRSPILKTLMGQIKDLVPDESRPIKFFSALETPLDDYHGVDAFFVQGDAFATLDVSLREKPSHKADAFLMVAFDKDGKPVVDPRDMKAAARTIADALVERARPKQTN
jgi:hypothetical protein